MRRPADVHLSLVISDWWVASGQHVWSVWHYQGGSIQVDLSRKWLIMNHVIFARISRSYMGYFRAKLGVKKRPHPKCKITYFSRGIKVRKYRISWINFKSCFNRSVLHYLELRPVSADEIGHLASSAWVGINGDPVHRGAERWIRISRLLTN